MFLTAMLFSDSKWTIAVHQHNLLGIIFILQVLINYSISLHKNFIYLLNISHEIFLITDLRYNKKQRSLQISQNTKAECRGRHSENGKVTRVSDTGRNLSDFQFSVYFYVSYDVKENQYFVLVRLDMQSISQAINQGSSALWNSF